MRLFVLLRRELYLYRRSGAVLAVVSFFCMFLLGISTSPTTFFEGGEAIQFAFAMACAAILIGLMLSINMICMDYSMLRRELRMGIGALRLICAKTLMILLLSIGMSALLTLPFFINLFGIPELSTLYLYCAVLFTMLASAELGLMISTLSVIFPGRLQLAALSIPIIMVYQILFSGFIFDKALIRLDRSTISNYAIRAIGSGLRFDRPEFYDTTKHGQFAITQEHIIHNLGWLFVFFIVSGIVSTIVLYLIDKKGLTDI